MNKKKLFCLIYFSKGNLLGNPKFINWAPVKRWIRNKELSRGKCTKWDEVSHPRPGCLVWYMYRRGKEQMSNISNPWCKLWAITLPTNSVGMTYLGILRSSWLVPTAPQCEDTQGTTLNIPNNTSLKWCTIALFSCDGELDLCRYFPTSDIEEDIRKLISEL